MRNTGYKLDAWCMTVPGQAMSVSGESGGAAGRGQVWPGMCTFIPTHPRVMMACPRALREGIQG